MQARSLDKSEIDMTQAMLKTDDKTTDELNDQRFAQACAEAVSVAARFADAVDRDARFPNEAIEALRAQRLLSMSVPASRGGQGASLQEVAEVCRALGSVCASTAMVFAMHQSQLYCLVEHAPDDRWFNAYFADLVENERLVASATSEVSVGGDLGRSICCVQPDHEGTFKLVKEAPTISYGAYADTILVTARRDAEARATEQVLVALKRADFDLQPTSEWNTLGMRGTASGGFVLTGRGAEQQVLPLPFAEIAARTMSPVSYILWASAWRGIAEDAVRRAQKFYRQRARSTTASLGNAGTRLVEAVGNLRLMAATINDAIIRRDEQLAKRAMGTCNADSYGSSVVVNDLKVRMSSLALGIVQEAMMVCGVAAYKNDSPYSLGRHLRDLHSAPIMVNNDRLISTMSVMMLAERLT